MSDDIKRALITGYLDMAIASVDAIDTILNGVADSHENGSDEWKAVLNDVKGIQTIHNQLIELKEKHNISLGFYGAPDMPKYIPTWYAENDKAVSDE